MKCSHHHYSSNRVVKITFYITGKDPSVRTIKDVINLFDLKTGEISSALVKSFHEKNPEAVYSGHGCILSTIMRLNEKIERKEKKLIELRKLKMELVAEFEFSDSDND